MNKHTLLKYIILGAIAAAVATFLMPKSHPETSVGTPRDYSEIKQEGVLRAATEYNTIGFHVHEDSVSGFHYELLQAFAHDQGLKLEVVPMMSFEKQLQGLENGSYDLLASSILYTSELKDTLLLTHPILLNKEVLVQRKPLTAEDSTRYISNQLELAGKTLHVVKGSPAKLRIRNLATEIADTIYIKEVEKYGPEQLAAMVAHGDIDYAVCDEMTAKATLDSMPQLDIHTAISFKQFYAWAVNPHAPVLLDSLNTWLDTYLKSKKYRLLYKRYF